MDLDHNVDTRSSRSRRKPPASPISCSERPSSPSLPLMVPLMARKRARPVSFEVDGVEALDRAPAHLRKLSNRNEPITLIDSDEEDPPPRLKRARLDIQDDVFGGKSSATKDGRPEAAAESSTSSHRDSPTADLLRRVLDVFPDLDAEWALFKLRCEGPTGYEERINAVIDAVLAMEGGYPKEPLVRPQQPKLTYDSVLYNSELRGSPAYREQSLAALQDQFPMMPSYHILKTFRSHQQLYYQTYLALAEHETMSTKPYAMLRRPRPGRGALPEKRDEQETSSGSTSLKDESRDPEWLREYNFLMSKLERDAAEAAETASKQTARDLAQREGDSMECGCCFDDQILEEMFQCAEGHLFCRGCCTRHAEQTLGNQSTIIACMDTSGCQAQFPEVELSRLLPPKSLSLYHRLQQAAEIALANIEGLETCPACDYAVIIDDPQEKLFRCQKDGCRKVTCRQCRREGHLPKSCAEVEADRKLDKRHMVEDAMTAALIRKCPKCDKAFLKEHGCNKITCSGCGTVSCYICRQAITNSYAHFREDRPTSTSADEDAPKCILWDANEASRDREAVIAARNAAQQLVLEDAARSGMSLDKSDLDIDAPRPSAPALPRPAHIPRPANGHRLPDLAMRMEELLVARWNQPGFNRDRPADERGRRV